MLEKRGRTVDPDGLKRFREVMESESASCEMPTWWPLADPNWHRDQEVLCTGRMEVAHIEPRRMGGGSRNDAPDNLAWLCTNHHRQFDAGQSREKIEAMRAHIKRTRHPAIKRLLGYEE